jgi:UMF1 family MFS transporter
MATLSFSIATYLSGSAHIGMATLIVFLGLGFVLLLRVPERAAN